MLGPWQIVIVVLLIVVFFGRGKISGLMGDVGKGITSFRKGLKEGTEADSAVADSSVAEPKAVADKSTSETVVVAENTKEKADS
ncbi:MAG: twin-arginine translocase TatA/TatE family subunit [Kordiimonadaceae bacterium]|nr:twin-arginine translocase TatA/TatE family subunit [Kordiimonadaceae bacterium]